MADDFSICLGVAIECHWIEVMREDSKETMALILTIIL